MSGQIYEAVVVSGNDPLGQGRVRVVVPQVSGAALSTWALPTVRVYGPAPSAGSTVWVSLDTGDPGKPVYHAAGVYSPWTAIPASWLSSGWSAPSAAFRTGPGGCVQWRGCVSTSTITLGLSTLLLSAQGAAPPVPVYSSAVLLTPNPVVGSVLMSTDGSLAWTGGAASYTGTAQIYLSTLSYATR